MGPKKASTRSNSSPHKPSGGASNRANQGTAPPPSAGQSGRKEESDDFEKEFKEFDAHLDLIGISPAAKRKVLRSFRIEVNKSHTVPDEEPQAVASSSNAGDAIDKGASPSKGKKRKVELSLQEEIEAYKQNLDGIIDHVPFEPVFAPTCSSLRSKINKLLDSGIMTKAEFARAIGVSPKSLSTFLSNTGIMGGSKSPVRFGAFAWFKQREIMNLKMPDVKKRQEQEQKKAAEIAEPGPSVKKAKTTASSLPDISDIYLDYEETDEVPVYDTCDEVRKKINAHMRTPGLTQAQFCRDIFAQLNAPKCKQIQSKQLGDFRGQSGLNTGAKSTVPYAAYVYFEKLRIAQGKPKSTHREDMEEIWWPQGYPRDQDHRTVYVGRADTFASGNITLVLSSHDGLPFSASNAHSQPLYELSRGVAVLSNANSTVTFSRLGHAVQQTTEGEPMVKERLRHLYDPEHASTSL
ncbi:hypothetical protein SCUP234_01923 [Seiridium cupressi]